MGDGQTERGMKDLQHLSLGSRMVVRDERLVGKVVELRSSWERRD